MKVGRFEVVDHGTDHEQYFQGCGTAFTPFDNVVTGCGDGYAEAVDDCLDQMAANGADVDGLEERIEGLAEAKLENPAPMPEDFHYYVSIRYGRRVRGRQGRGERRVVARCHLGRVVRDGAEALGQIERSRLMLLKKITYSTTNEQLTACTKAKLQELLYGQVSSTYLKKAKKPELVAWAMDYRDGLATGHRAAEKAKENRRKKTLLLEKSNPNIDRALRHLYAGLLRIYRGARNTVNEFRREVANDKWWGVEYDLEWKADNVFDATQLARRVLPLASFVARQLINRTLTLKEIRGHFSEMLEHITDRITDSDFYAPNSTSPMKNMLSVSEFRSHQKYVRILKFVAAYFPKDVEQGCEDFGYCSSITIV